MRVAMLCIKVKVNSLGGVERGIWNIGLPYPHTIRKIAATERDIKHTIKAGQRYYRMTYLFPTHSDICVLLNGPWILASSLFSHLYSHITASISPEEVVVSPDDAGTAGWDTGASENMSTGSAREENIWHRARGKMQSVAALATDSAASYNYTSSLFFSLNVIFHLLVGITVHSWGLGLRILAHWRMCAGGPWR